MGYFVFPSMQRETKKIYVFPRSPGLPDPHLIAGGLFWDQDLPVNRPGFP
jgi:hypothetical protein